MQIIESGMTLHLVGDFDVRSTGEVREAIYAHLAEAGEAPLVVDMSGVEVVDVTALKVLAAATRRASREGLHVRVRGCRPAVRRMLHISRLIRLLEVEREPVAA